MAAFRYTVSVDDKLVAEFKRVCKERGRSQAFYIQAAMRRVIGESGESSAGASAAVADVKRRRPAKRKG